jgi:hypothetical protein
MDEAKTPCLECADNLDLPPILCEYAATQEVIVWDNFVMGMVSHIATPLANHITLIGGLQV